MQINGLPNKFEIFQDYYYETNGVMITYAEALKLFSKMDADEKSAFEEYYQDEVGYELISATKGYNINSSANGAKSTQAAIDIKYTLEAFAKEQGYVIDPQWAEFSAEEIIQMEQGGVNIPQEILDIAHSIYDSESIKNTQTTDDDCETTEKEPFLNLIPKAAKKIQKCEENNEKIEDEINDLLPERNRQQKKLTNKMKEQQASLKEYEAFVREWRQLQNKVNNGEALSNSEAKRYAQLTGFFNDNKSKDNGFEIDKREIARSLNEINILAVLGEKLAEETIEIGDNLADYTSKNNYKSTFKTVSGQVGLFSAISKMVTGKNLAVEAAKIGNDTEEFTDETHQSVMDIAQIMEIESSITNPQTTETPETEPTLEEEAAIEKTQTEGAPAEAQEATETTDPDNVSADQEIKDEINNPEVSVEEDFIVDDDSVTELAKEAVKINADLVKQTVSAAKDMKEAKEDEKAAKLANKRITRYVKEFKETTEEDDKAENSINTVKGENKFEKSEKQTKIQEFEQNTQKESEFIQESIPEQMEAQEADTEYDQEIIPADKEQLDFTSNSGETLAKMGAYRILTGLEQIAAFQFVQGTKNVAKGTISTTIGMGAIAVSETPAPKLAEKATESAVKNEDKALDQLGEVDSQIAEVTGETTVTEQTKAQMSDNEDAEKSAEEDVETSMTDANVDASIQDAAKSAPAMQAPAGGQTPASSTPLKGGASAMMVLASQNEKSKIRDIVNQRKGTSTSAEVTTPVKSQASPEQEGENALKEGADLQKDSGSGSSQANAIGNSATSDSKESEKIKKDTEKDEKQLQKETKSIQKQMQKDQKEIEKMTKESQSAATKQAEILVQYEAVTQESEEIASVEEQKQQGVSVNDPTGADQTAQQGAGATSAIQMGRDDGNNANIEKLQENEITINTLGSEFKIQGNVITRNQTKIKNLQKSTKTNEKKFQQKCKTRQKKLKETQKAEQEKQAKLKKQLGAVGIIENMFSLVSLTGTIYELVTSPPLLSNPFTAALGAATMSLGVFLEVVGALGSALCQVVKGIINIANGNLTAGLISIGTAAVTAAMSMVGAGGASSGVMTAVSAGLKVVSTSTELVNNVRQVQGKEANGTLSKISTISGIAGSVTNAASGIKNASGAFGTAMAVTSAVGTAASGASQIMTEFNLGDQKTANILGMVGGGLQTAASIGQIAQKFSGASAANKNTEEKTEQLENNQNNDAEGTEGSESKESKTDESQTDKKDSAKTEEFKDDTPADVLQALGIPAPQQQQTNTQTSQNNMQQQLANNAQTDINKVSDTKTVDANDIKRLESNAPKDITEALGIKMATVDQAQLENVNLSPMKKAGFFDKMGNLMDKASPYMEAAQGVIGIAGKALASTNDNPQQDQKRRGGTYKPTAEEKKRLRKYQRLNQARSAYYRNYRYSV